MGSKHEAGIGVRLQTALTASSGSETERDSESISCLRAIRTKMIETMMSVNKMMKKMKLLVFFLFRFAA